MCTYRTTKITVEGSGKGATGWFPLVEATVYFDHPVHANAAHTLNIDLLNPGRGPGARVAVELDAGSARARRGDHGDPRLGARGPRRVARPDRRIGSGSGPRRDAAAPEDCCEGGGVLELGG